MGALHDAVVRLEEEQPLWDALRQALSEAGYEWEEHT